MSYVIDGGSANGAPSSVPPGALTAGQIITETLPKLAGKPPTGTTIWEAINHISMLLTKRLHMRKSDLLRSTEMELEITADDGTSYDLPADHLSLAEKPFFADGVFELEPLDKPRAELVGLSVIRPNRYELLDTQIIFYPTFTDSFTVKARYYAATIIVGSPGDAIPFNGTFDEVYRKGVPRVILAGLSTVQSDPEFERFVHTEVDTVINARSGPLPSNRTSRRNYL